MITIKKKEKVDELFNDSNVEFDKREIIPNESFVYYIKFNGKKYSYQFHKENNEWLFGFADEDYNDEITNNARDITYQVFNGAVQVIKQFVDEYIPEKFVFYSNPSEPSRTKLYQMLIKKMDSWFKSKGYSFKSYDEKYYNKEFHFFSFTKDSRIDELNLDGYKEIAKTKWEFPDDLVGYLKYHDFEMIGQGDLSCVFQSPTENFVVKVNKGRVEKEYSKFIDCARKNKSDPHFPRFGKIRMIEHESYKFYVLFIEKLAIGSDNPGFNINYACEFISDAWMWIKGDLNEFNSIEQSEDLLNVLKERDKKYNDGMMFKTKFADQYLELIKTLFKMSDYIDADYLDIHPGNVGLRGETLVILDPVRAIED